MNTIICLLGIMLLFGLPFALIVFLYRMGEVRNPDGISHERRTFYIFLISIIATGFVIALGIVFKSDWLFVIGFVIFGIVTIVRRAINHRKIGDQDSPAGGEE